MIVDDRCWGSSEDVNLPVGAYVHISNVFVLPIGKVGGGMGHLGGLQVMRGAEGLLGGY